MTAAWLILAAMVALAGEPRSDVLVYGGTPAGVAAAVTAARLGADVLLLEPTNHVGGIIANGLTNADIINRKAIAGFFEEFIGRIREYYVSTYGAESPQLRACREGYYFEPSAAEKVLLKMLAEQTRVRLVLGQRLVQPVMQGSTITGLVAAARQKPERRVTYCAAACIDATYEGDLAAAAGVRCRVGREARQEYGELHAGRIFTYFGQNDPLEGSSGEGDRGVQAYCFRIYATRVPANRVPIEKPPSYNPADYDLLAADFRAGRVKKLADAIQLYPMPNDKWEINSNHVTTPEKGPSESLDLAEEVWDYPLADEAQREKIIARCRSYNQGLLWFLGHDERVPAAVREEMLKFGLCKDEFADNGYWPRQVYVRETRRIVGLDNFTENDGRVGELDRTRLQPGSIAVAEFPWDCHGVHKYDPAHPGSREGYFYVAHPPVQVPYGVLVPRDVEGLLVPVCCSASHVGYQSLRVEPMYMALGQAAGAAAWLAVVRRTDLHDVPLEDLQIRLIEQHAVITYYEDLPTRHPAFAALQFLGARGLNPGYKATPDAKLSRQAAAARLLRITTVMGLTWTPPLEALDQPLLGNDLAAWLRTIGWNVPAATSKPLSDQPLTLADFAQWIYQAIRVQRPTIGRALFRRW